MSDPPRLVYSPRLDATQQGELNALAACYALILQKHQERKKATGVGSPDDARKDQDAPTTTKNYTS